MNRVLVRLHARLAPALLLCLLPCGCSEDHIVDAPAESGESWSPGSGVPYQFTEVRGLDTNVRFDLTGEGRADLYYHGISVWEWTFFDYNDFDYRVETTAYIRALRGCRIHPAVLEAGDRIDRSIEWGRDDLIIAERRYTGENRWSAPWTGPLVDAEDVFIGFTVGEGRNRRYGWFLLSVDSKTGEPVLVDHALGNECLAGVDTG